MAKKNRSSKSSKPAKKPKAELPDISTLRGVARFYYDNSLVLVRGEVENVARELQKLRKAKKWEKNAVGKPVTLSRQCFIIFRLRGHQWTEILGRDNAVVDAIRSSSNPKEIKKMITQARKVNLNADDAKTLSKRLKTGAIFYGVSDTAAALEYQLFDNGKPIEQLKTVGGWRTVEYKSSLRSLHAGEITDAQDHTTSLFKQLDAFEPSLKFMYLVGYAMHKPGDKVTFRDSEGMFERLDFVAM